MTKFKPPKELIAKQDRPECKTCKRYISCSTSDYGEGSAGCLGYIPTKPAVAIDKPIKSGMCFQEPKCKTCEGSGSIWITRHHDTEPDESAPCPDCKPTIDKLECKTCKRYISCSTSDYGEGSAGCLGYIPAKPAIAIDEPNEETPTDEKTIENKVFRLMCKFFDAGYYDITKNRVFCIDEYEIHLDPELSNLYRKYKKQKTSTEEKIRERYTETDCRQGSRPPVGLIQQDILELCDLADRLTTENKNQREFCAETKKQYERLQAELAIASEKIIKLEGALRDNPTLADMDAAIFENNMLRRQLATAKEKMKKYKTFIKSELDHAEAFVDFHNGAKKINLQGFILRCQLILGSDFE